MAKKEQIAADLSTEEKIKEAARKVFTRKGYAATRTRDIAEEAGINLALLNYYFRSKEKLFNQVMMEKVQQLFGVLLPVLNDPSTRLEVKIERIVSNYIDMLLKNPDLPIFVLSELKGQAEQLKKVLPIEKIIPNASFIKQLQDKRPDISPLHFLMNILGMTVFPFIAMPAFDVLGIINKNAFEAMIAERKKLIPIWVKAMLKAK
ncbi:MAG TPA: TetR family transcriptional regulator [Chitinophagaceae bacterium]